MPQQPPAAQPRQPPASWGRAPAQLLSLPPAPAPATPHHPPACLTPTVLPPLRPPQHAFDFGLFFSGIPLAVLSRAANITLCSRLINTWRAHKLPLALQRMLLAVGLRGAVAYGLGGWPSWGSVVLSSAAARLHLQRWGVVDLHTAQVARCPWPVPPRLPPQSSTCRARTSRARRASRPLRPRRCSSSWPPREWVPAWLVGWLAGRRGDAAGLKTDMAALPPVAPPTCGCALPAHPLLLTACLHPAA